MENKTENKDKDVLFVDINPDNPITEIESLCLSCNEKGMTRLLPTKIPFFKEVIIMSFSCPHCGYKNTEVEPGDDLPDQGIKFTLNVTSGKDMNRQVIKSNFGEIQIPFCGLTIPTSTQKGKLSTVEGFITTARDQFKESIDSGYYSEMGEDFINKIKVLIDQLTECLEGKKFPFEFILDDPSGRSFIENPYAPQTDVNINLDYYDRTKEQLEAMGFSIENQIDENKQLPKEKKENTKQYINPSYYNKQKDFSVYKANSKEATKILDFTNAVDLQDEEELNKYGCSFDQICDICNAPGKLRFCFCQIPYFKEIIISCFKCDNCGNKSVNVKGGGGISEKGLKITLNAEKKEDLNRDVFKSETSSITIPELGFESSEGSLGSMFTTVEGIIDKIIENLENNPFMVGDSAERQEVFDKFIERLKGLKEMKEKFTLILDDPLANSFIFPIGETDKDEGIIKEEYERTFEQNESLGLNHMKVD